MRLVLAFPLRSALWMPPTPPSAIPQEKKQKAKRNKQKDNGSYSGRWGAIRTR
jgi:hypothetical protein